MRSCGLLLLLLFCCSSSWALDNGLALTPPMGWSTWNAFKEHINETLIRESAEKMAASAFKKAGYEYILIDDGWSKCLVREPITAECLVVWPRNEKTKEIPLDEHKFPSGMKALSQYVHSLGLKIGIYTAMSHKTCGGFTGSLGFEEIDAKSFAEWEMDFVKLDTCNLDCSVHDGCQRRSAEKMRDALNATGRPMLYYLDAGNPTSAQKMYNPHNYHVTNRQALAKVATSEEEDVWSWAPNVANMFKSWFDRLDTWESMLTNAHNQIRLAEFQRCGAFHMPDYLCTGSGGQSPSQYRAEFFLWTILGAPLLIASDIRTMSDEYIEMLTNPEILAVDQDPDCTQGSLVSAFGASEVWMRPLHDQSFACVMLNKGDEPANVTVYMNHKKYHWGDFYPAFVSHMQVRDIFKRQDLGHFSDTFTQTVGPMDAAIFRFYPKFLEGEEEEEENRR